MSEKQAMLTVKEAAAIVRRSPDTIYRWIDEGFLTDYTRVRDGYLIPRAEIDRLMVRAAVRSLSDGPG